MKGKERRTISQAEMLLGDCVRFWRSCNVLALEGQFGLDINYGGRRFVIFRSHVRSIHVGALSMGESSLRC